MSSDLSVIASLPSNEVKAAAERALKNKKDQDDALVKQGGVAKFVQSAQNSLLFQPDCRWDDMLSSAPLSISVMGSIFIASTTATAGKVVIYPPTGGFKYVASFTGGGEMFLQAALAQISSQGNVAFTLASKNMSSIAAFSDRIIDNVKNFTQLLGDPESAKILLKQTTDSLKKSTQQCGDLAREMAAEYHKWLGAACEVHAACCQTSTDVAQKQRDNQVHLAAQLVQPDASKKAADVAKDNLDVLKESLKHAEEQYKKAANEFSSGWSLVGTEIVSNLAGTINSALKQAVPVLVSKLSYNAQAAEAVNIFKGDQGVIKDGEKVDHSKVPDATSKNTPLPNVPVLPADYEDIAYNIIQSAYGNVQIVVNLLNAEGGKIDWKSIESMDPDKTKTGLAITKILLQGDLDRLGSKAGDKPPTTSLKAIIKTSLTTIDGINQYTGSNLAGKSKPADDSAEVKNWKTSMSDAYIKATTLFQTSQTIPGAKTPPMPQPDGNPQTPDGAGFRAQIIGAATTKLNSASAVLQTSKTNFQASSKNYQNAVQDFGNIQTDLAKLNADNVQLNEIRALLLKCIELLIQVQDQINKLVAFFAAIDAIVTVVVETQVDPFLAQINAGTSAPLAVGGYTMTDFMSFMLFNSMLNIRCYFTLFQNLAKLYMEIHLKYLVNELEILNQMQVEAADDTNKEKALNAKQSTLNTYTNTNLPKIQEEISGRQKKVMDSLEEETTAAANDVAIVPANLPLVQSQIESVSKESAAIAEKGIQASGSYARASMKFSTA